MNVVDDKAANHLPVWTKDIILPVEESDEVLRLLASWNVDQDFIDKHNKDFFLIYGPVRRQEETINKIVSIYQKYKP